MDIHIRGFPLLYSIHMHSMIHSHALAHWMKARVKVHGLVGRKQGEALSTLKLEKEVVSAIIMSVCHNALSTNP